MLACSYFPVHTKELYITPFVSIPRFTSRYQQFWTCNYGHLFPKITRRSVVTRKFHQYVRILVYPAKGPFYSRLYFPSHQLRNRNLNKTRSNLFQTKGQGPTIITASYIVNKSPKWAYNDSIVIIRTTKLLDYNLCLMGIRGLKILEKKNVGVDNFLANVGHCTVEP